MKTAKKINGLVFAKMLQAGCVNLRNHAQEINDLNVFPIPDGDTGDNMLFTIVGGVNAVGDGVESLSRTARQVSEGMLLSARGNSGVILSQIFEGIANGLEGIDEGNNDAIIHALQEGVKHSYNAVMDPTEGTMLTVFRIATEQVSLKKSNDFETLLQDFLNEAKQVLKKTPDMLPALKKANVVDSGGAGLVCIGDGMLSALKGDTNFAEHDHSVEVEQEINVSLFTEDSILEYGYCTELLLRLQKSKTDTDTFEVSTITQYLKSIGDSVVAFKTGSIIKIHIHTMTPDKVLSFCQRYGEFLKIKIENMSLQHNNISLDNSDITKNQRKAFGIVAVASGEGVKRFFTECGADVIVDGGQSMNPSIENFLDAFRKVNADTVYVFPNNGNIILAAKQAAEMYKDSHVRVIECHTIGEGYSALSILDFRSENAEQVEKELNDATKNVITAEISRSIRDTENIKAGEYIGFVKKNILCSQKSRYKAACKTFDILSENEFEICILIKGKDADTEEANQIKEYITVHYPDKEVHVIDGMQEIYDYIMILE